MLVSLRPSAAVSTVLFLGCVLAGVVAGMIGFAGSNNPVGLGVFVVAGIVLGSILAASVKVVAQWEMMSRQASSEREKRATIIKADGDRQAAAALAEAAATMAASPGAMQLRTLQTIDGLGPSASNTVVLAVPLEVIDVMRSYIQKNQRPD
jgi:regulator of protease activity HflC (stomatin/prohibitin superfamily)